jgi:hypothetical protein
MSEKNEEEMAGGQEHGCCQETGSKTLKVEIYILNAMVLPIN